ncbi:MAG: glycosyltransferase family 9 protein [Bacteroidetes bacterium]|nr:glycosyltransferase family 9 protein [Bacteroidota bacterium]
MKILVIRFSSIGDIVLTTPVVRCLKQQTGAEVHFLTKRSFEKLASSNPYIDKVQLYGDSLQRCIRRLREENYDLIIDLHHNLRTFIIKQQIRKKSYSFNKLNVQKWLLTTFKIDRLPDEHIVDRYLDTCRPLGVANDGAGLDYFIPDKDVVDISTLPADFHNGYIAWVVGAKQATKQFPNDKIIEVIDKVRKPVILLGGKEDRAYAKFVMNGLIAGRIPAYNACGEFTLNQSASVVQQSQLVVTNDTGLMHIAAALKKKIISLWGNTVPEFGMYPYYGHTLIDNKIMQVPGLSCRPCSKIGYDECPKGHFRCMRNISDKEIAAAINMLYEPKQS